MKAIRRVVKRDEIKFIDIPMEFGDKIEIIVLPAKNKDIYTMDSISENDRYLIADYNVVIEDDEHENEVWKKYI